MDTFMLMLACADAGKDGSRHWNAEHPTFNCSQKNGRCTAGDERSCAQLHLWIVSMIEGGITPPTRFGAHKEPRLSQDSSVQLQRQSPTQVISGSEPRFSFD